jgi:hypothetical protein
VDGSNDANAREEESSMDRLADVEHPSEAQLLDVLYEMLAQGSPAHEGGLARADVERFLHEHARAPKPRAELLRFFDVHGLPTEASELSADRELGALARGLQRERSSRAPSLPPPALAAVPAAEGDTGDDVGQSSDPDASSAKQRGETGTARVDPLLARGAARVDPLLARGAARVDEVEDEATSPRARRPGRPARGADVLRAVLLLMGAALIGMGFAFHLSLRRADGLAAALIEAHTAQREAERALRGERERSAQLRAELAESERAWQDALALRDQKLLAAERARESSAARYAAENRVLERVFGPRFGVAHAQMRKVGVPPPF